MGVRPPQRDDDGGPEIVAFGIAALDEHLERSDVVFPTTTDELLEAIGDPAVPYDAAGNELRLSEALEETPRSTFETRQEFMNTLHPVFEARRQRSNRSLVGRLRSLVPF